MSRIYNFSAGPSTLPLPVLEQVQAELTDWQGSGMSVMEMSHRSALYEGIQRETEANLRALIGIPDSYAVLFLQGGATQQFSQIPLAFLPASGYADYIVTGEWGVKARAAAEQVGRVNTPWDAGDGGYNRVPVDFVSDRFAAYTHFASNETIHGVQFPTDPPAAGNWVCDMSSDICSRPLDVTKYALIYAGAQKNIGPAGLTLVIVRRDFLDRMPAEFPPYLDYRLHAASGSLYHTPPTFAIYVTGLVTKHLLQLGGLEAVQRVNQEKARIVYEQLDGQFYRGHARPSARSLMNVTFTLPTEELTTLFVKESTAAGLDGLKGHRSVGGIRASLYNAMPVDGALTLADFMRDFAARNR
jgi:phosphoserine aminotransferase